MARKDYQPDRIMGHADEADGIEEYDNKLPNWWLGLFVVTIIIAIYMLLDWHVIGNKTLAELYDDQMEAAADQYAGLVAEPPVDYPLDQAAVTAGAALFQANCVACHGEDGKGRVGPDLTDHVWIHGGTPNEIAATIFNGVPEQGMVTWGPILGTDGVAQVAAYVVSLGGADVEGDVAVGHTEPADNSQQTETPQPPDEQTTPEEPSEAPSPTEPTEEPATEAPTPTEAAEEPATEAPAPTEAAEEAAPSEPSEDAEPAEEAAPEVPAEPEGTGETP